MWKEQYSTYVALKYAQRAIEIFTLLHINYNSLWQFLINITRCIRSKLKIRHDLLHSSASLTILLIIALLVCRSFTGSDVCSLLINSNNSQVWVDTLNDVKIHFTYELNKPTINKLNELNFTVQDLKTNKNLKNITGNILVLNSPDPTFEFDNLTAPAGVFSIKCPFLNQGLHQVIANIHGANSSGIALASFRINVPQNKS